MHIFPKVEIQTTFVKIYMEKTVFTPSWNFILYWCAKFQKIWKTSKCDVQDYFDKLCSRLYVR
jgi:hypothetical protein